MKHVTIARQVKYQHQALHFVSRVPPARTVRPMSQNRVASVLQASKVKLLTQVKTYTLAQRAILEDIKVNQAKHFALIAKLEHTQAS